MKRIIVFIDSNNFEKAVNDLYGQMTHLDYNALCEYIASKRGGQLEKWYYYTAKSSNDKERASRTQKFVNYLKNTFAKCVTRVGFLKWEGKTDTGKDIYVEKETDVMIAVDMVTLAFENLYDEAILLSADTDYKAAISVVQRYKKVVVAGVVDQQRAGFIKQLCGDFLILSKEDLDKLKR